MTITTTPQTARVRLTGDLDYESIDELVTTASRLLAQHVDLADLHLDFSELAFLDSAALSGLLLIHRHTAHSGVELYLDHRPAFLDRVLQVTGLFGHFVMSDADAAGGDSNLFDQATSGETRVR
ncbi:MAG: STAS domain-containing protein [Mycobacterium sp.]